MSKKEENKELDRAAIHELINELEYTANQVENLLKEVIDQKVDSATFKNELLHTSKTVEELADIIRNGGGSNSILTRLALLESAVEAIKVYADEDSDSGDELEIKIALIEQKIESLTEKIENLEKKGIIISEGKWKLYVAIAGGFITLVGTLAVAIMKYLL